MPRSLRPSLPPLLLADVIALAAAPALAGDKFHVTNVECETFFNWRRTPTLHYDITDERQADYRDSLPDDYFRGAAARTAEYCERTSVLPRQPLGPPRKIRGVWFQSNDGQFKVLYDVERDTLDTSAGVVNRIGDRWAVEQRAAAQHAAQLDEIRTREARARELEAARVEAARAKAAADAKAAQDKAAAESARDQAFLARPDLQLARLGATVTAANFTTVANVRTNPFHFRKLGLAVVRTQFNRMLSDKVALFGNELAPVFIHTEDVDRFTRSGETVMLAFRVVERGEAERSYGSLPEVILSMMKAEPLYGVYVGAYSCPGDDCGHVLDVPPPA